MNKTIKQKTVNGKIIKLTDNSFDRQFYKLQPKKWIVLEDYTSKPSVYASFFSFSEAKSFYYSVKQIGK